MTAGRKRPTYANEGCVDKPINVLRISNTVFVYK